MSLTLGVAFLASFHITVGLVLHLCMLQNTSTGGVLTYISLRMSSLGILALCRTLFLLSTVHYLEIVLVTIQCMECSLCFAKHVSSLFETVT